MKLFYPENHYNPECRAQLFPLLRPVITGKLLPDISSGLSFVVSNQEFYITPKFFEADLVILTMSWNYYYKKNKKEQALHFIEQAKQAKKTVWVSLLGDFGLEFPNFNNIIVFRSSGYFSKLPSWHKGLPVFITDPFKYQYFKRNVGIPEYKDKPKIGFCGLASNNGLTTFQQLVKTVVKNIGYYLKIYKQTPEALVVAPYLRYKCLKQLQASSRLETKFIIRKKYRAGAKTKKDRDQSTKEYFNNILESQYVLCVRGAGNFSTRFYETLAMGRIPVYLDSDGLLPLSKIIDWKKHVVWVDWHERFNIAEKIIDFHKSLNEESMQALGASNRALWESNLQTGGFLKNPLIYK